MPKRPRSPSAGALDAATGLFREQGGTLRTREAIALGIHPRTLYAMRDAGILEQLSRGLFRLADLPPLGHPDLVPVALRVPDGVLCLLSALSLHGLTTQIPHEVYLALPRGADRPRLDHPPLRVFWFTGRAFSEGIEVHPLDGVEVRVYGAAKSVADCFKYRNKIGIDVAVEALRLFLRRKGSKVDDLMHYARICRVERVIQPYVEATL